MAHSGFRSVIGQAPKESPLLDVPKRPDGSSLHKFISLPEDMVVILGPRRVPAIPCPPSNTDKSISVLASVGFRQLSADQYVGAIKHIQPDIAVGMADLVVGQKPGVKRRQKMADRTHAFTAGALDRLYTGNSPSRTAFFAPVLPLDNAAQAIYLSELEDEDTRSLISGLALYESASLSVIPEELGHLPRLVLGGPATPQDILRDVALGADLLTVPFVGASSDAGLALDFTFPALTPSSSSSPPIRPHSSRPLALDMRSSVYATDTTPISEGCKCYACQNHHRAYIRHLLTAKELIAWTLLQIHNYHVMDAFFSGVRKSIGSGALEQDLQAFERAYESSFPEQSGPGPRYV